MISRHSKIISNLIHDINQITAVRQCSDRRSLDRVACIHQCHIGRLHLHLPLVKSQSGVTDIIINTAMHIIGVENYNILRRDCPFIPAAPGAYLGSCRCQRGSCDKGAGR